MRFFLTFSSSKQKMNNETKKTYEKFRNQYQNQHERTTTTNSNTKKPKKSNKNKSSAKTKRKLLHNSSNSKLKDSRKDQGKHLGQNAKQAKKPHIPPHLSAQNNDLWTVSDDKLLIENVEKTCDFSIIFKCVKFSHNFSVEDIINRWHALLFDPVTQNLSYQRMMEYEQNGVDEYLKNNNKHEKEGKNKVLPSVEEISVLRRIKSNVLLENSQDFLSKIFQNERNFHIWSNLRWNNLLIDQEVNTELTNLNDLSRVKAKFATLQPENTNCTQTVSSESEPEENDSSSVDDAVIFRNSKLVDFEDKFGAASELIKADHFEERLSCGKVHRERNLRKIRDYLGLGGGCYILHT